MPQKNPEKTEETEKVENLEKPKVAEEVAKEAAENIVIVGRKPVMSYVVACVTCFNAGGNEVIVKAMGRAISKAVDTIELLRRAFMKDLEIKNINIGTKGITGENYQKFSVSTIEITVGKSESK